MNTPTFKKKSLMSLHERAIRDLKKGTIIEINGQPCKLIDKSISKVGYHPTPKVYFVGVNIFTGKKEEEIKRIHSETIKRPDLSLSEDRVVGCHILEPESSDTEGTDAPEMKMQFVVCSGNESSATQQESIQTISWACKENIQCVMQLAREASRISPVIICRLAREVQPGIRLLMGLRKLCQEEQEFDCL